MYMYMYVYQFAHLILSYSNRSKQLEPFETFESTETIELWQDLAECCAAAATVAPGSAFAWRRVRMT